MSFKIQATNFIDHVNTFFKKSIECMILSTQALFLILYL